MPLTYVALAEGVTPTLMQTIMESMKDAFTLVGTILTEITEQPLLLFLLAASLIPIGISVFGSLKNAARA